MSGIFNPNVFNATIFNTGESSEVIKTGTGGIDGGGKGKHKGIVKPLGTLGLPKKTRKAVEVRVDESREIQAEIASRLAREFSEEVEQKPIAKMTMAEVESEIGTLLRKQIRTEEDETMLILLMMAASL